MLFLIAVESKCFERGWVTERDGGPTGFVGSVSVVGEQSPFSGNSLELLGFIRHVVEIRLEKREAVAFGKLQSEATFLFDGVLYGVDLVRPGEIVAFESVADGVIRCYGEGNAVGGFRSRES